MASANTTYHQEQVDKLGNTLIYLSDKLNGLYKTKALKLLYILDESSIKQSGIPFLNLNYEVWHLGPVVKDIYVELSDGPSLLKDYITIEQDEQGNSIKALQQFVDDEFSDNDIILMDKVIKQFGHKPVKELIKYTHRENSLWYSEAVKNGILEELESKKKTTSSLEIDFSDLIKHDEQKLSIYTRYLEYN